MDSNVPPELCSMRTEDKRKSERMTENSDVLSQVQAAMKKNGRVRCPQHQAAGANGDVNGRPVAWARRSPKETAALINLHVERGPGRKKRTRALRCGAGKRRNVEHDQTCTRVGIRPIRT